MKAGLKKIFKVIFKATLFIIICIAIYFISAILLSIIPANRDFKNAEKGVTIFILSNGIHTDIIVPVKNEVIDWSEKIDYKNTPAKDSTAQYAGFGWGDKGFYIETKTWDDLKVSTAFKAMFALSETAMHITYHRKAPKLTERCKTLTITNDQYKILTEYIENSFEKNSAGKTIYINADAYGYNDMFYEAEGSYNLFNTCNTWANTALKKTGIKTAVWTPFDKGIFYHFD